MAEAPGSKGSADRGAYAAAGVDVEAGERAVALMQAAVATTRRPEVVGGLGGFGGAVSIPAGYRDPIIVTSTDGVGTKTAIATALSRYDTIGIDLVAMCADDVVCSGAEPLSFVDYVAVGRVDPAVVAELVAGVADGCRQAGCALVGGETAEHPGLMESNAFDLAGTCVGIVERERMIDGRAVRPGDAILGLGASGLHANGFSLIRAIVARRDLDLHQPYVEALRRSLGEEVASDDLGAEPEVGDLTLGEVLLAPTRVYARTVLDLRAALVASGHDLRGVAHITGGGLPGNVARMLPAGLGARVDPNLWRMPSVMRLFGALGGIDDAELRATLNGGIGMALTVAPEAAGPALEWLAAAGVPSWRVGVVTSTTDLGGVRYSEGPIA